MAMRLARALFFVATFVVVGAGTSPASAATYPVGANVTTVCNFNGNGNTATLTFNVTVASNGNTPAAPAAQSITNVSCNKASSLTVKSTSLRLNPPGNSLSTNQSQTMNITATASGTGVATASVTTQETTRLGSTTQYTGTPVAQLQIIPATTISVSLSSLTPVTVGGGSNVKLNSGTYTATVVVSITPNVP